MIEELPPSQVEALKDILFTTDDVTYAVVDSALSNDVHVTVQTEALDYRCLYEGKEADLLEEVAPYLVQLERDDYLTNWLFKTVYKKNAISFIQSSADIESLAYHLRQYAKIQAVTHGDDGKLTKQWAFFAFYDPRVFPRFMKGNTIEQSAEFFEGINQYLCESTDEDKNELHSYHYSEKNQEITKKYFDLEENVEPKESKQAENKNG
ncbi:MAG TPA: DUF4123 domain-containing protein [Leucothrix sp.]|nr:DUF4123 domain-containing protein [Leucothrix sp.]